MKIPSILFLVFLVVSVDAQILPPSGATEKTCSKSEYFTWINNTNEGATDSQTNINLDFFKWLHDTYGMQLDIYAFDAGAIDGSKIYGSMETERFKEHFPYGFGQISKKANNMGTFLGLWGGPDGFGDTPEEAQKRIDMQVSLVRDYNFRLFKMDAVCGQLRKEKYGYFDTMFKQIRSYAPDLILLNHRLDLGPGTKYSTTYLLGGAETYIDVHMGNDMTAPHHRACVLWRKGPSKLDRLVEDHGTCISSCLDYWEDDLILQAFSRNLILAPEIYGNPWLLKDEEFPYLAYIFNLHRDYNKILVEDAIRLPEEQYGYETISRGNSSTRFITLRNTSWNEKSYNVTLGDEIGLKKNSNKVKARLYHPYILDLGNFDFNSSIPVTVPPFRAVLLKVTTEKETDNILISGIPYQIINDRVGNNKEVKLLGEAGKSYKMKIEKGFKPRTEKVIFKGTSLKDKYHRKIDDMLQCNVPEDISAIYYATCFAADNNALEVRSVKRSGESEIKEVRDARNAFFQQKTFLRRGVWDKNLFDGDPDTYFEISHHASYRRPNGESSLMLDFGVSQKIDSLVFSTINEYTLFPYKILHGASVYVSNDLLNWQEIVMPCNINSTINLTKYDGLRYFMIENAPLLLTEIKGYYNGSELKRDNWKACNLFPKMRRVSKVWKSAFTLNEISNGSYLCVAINGEHGEEGAFAGFKIDGKYVGCPDRAPSFQCNYWECPVLTRNKNYTYYLPLTKEMVGKEIEAYVMSFNNDKNNLKPEVWITAYPIPFESRTLTQ